MSLFIFQPTRLPLPNQVKNLFQDEEDALKPENDHPDLHQGRQRSFAHVRGNWATFAFAHIPHLDLRPLQTEIMNKFRENDLDFQGHLIDDPHLSLTRVVTLRHHWIDPFVKQVRDKMAKHFKPFSVIFNGFKGKYSDKVQLNGTFIYYLNRKLIKSSLVLVNEDKTRSFLTLTLHPSSTLTSMISQLDSILEEFGLPGFYDPPSFHISLLWFLQDRESDLESFVRDLEQNGQFEFQTEFRIEGVHCKCGNKLFQIGFLQ